MNKDEAERCINIARRCISEGNTEKAEKFLKKSLALHESAAARELLKGLSQTPPSSSSNASSTSPPSSSTTSASSETRKRPNAGGGSTESSNGKEATADMVAAVNKVKGKKDYYTILGCAKTATESELKKAYRKLALALHPDKNCAAGANEAFKAVGNAYAVLSNSEKRVRYDKYGLDDDSPTPSRGHSHRYNRYYHDDEDISPEELFNMFFGGMQPNYRRGNRHTQFYSNYTRDQSTDANNASVISSLLQMSPLLLLILMSVLNSVFHEDPAWSYSRNGQYKVERSTSWNSIRYYVKGDFTEKYSNQKIVHLEYEIEKDYKQDLQIKCINNQRRKEQLMYQYRVTGNTRYRDYAEAMDLTSCKDYNDFKMPQYIRSNYP
ncbi:hypothetical protein ACHWQZ_G000166 [Mnemiopsis leidyi]